MSLHKSKIVPFSHLFMIEPMSDFNDTHFLNAVQQVIDTIIPDSLWMETKSDLDPETLFFRLSSMLPIFIHSFVSETSQFLSVSYLCPCESTDQARRYVIDTLNRGLNPGKQVEIAGSLSLNFQFAQWPGQRFFVSQEIFSIRNFEENLSFRKNLPALILQLKQGFSSEFLRLSRNHVHPIFMPRNEEETIRNLILLSSQIKYVRDLPQISIHYEKQTNVDLTFTVIVARLLKGEMEPLRKVLEKSASRIDIDHVRMMGYLKQKYQKEAAVLRFTLDKRLFFRPDFSVDFLKARQKVVSELTRCLGEFRDFNGGMILKQDEALGCLRQEIGSLSQEKEFLLENYFYSIKPGVMQTVHESKLLKRHFELLNIALDLDLKQKSSQIIGESLDKFFLCFVVSTSTNFKEKVRSAISPLEICPHDLTSTSLEMENKTTIGFILRAELSELVERFRETLSKLINES